MINIKRKIDIKSIIIIISLFFTTLYLTQNLNNPNLWYDEAGQFWMAKGLHHFSKPYSPENGYHSIARINRCYNLDPGGFTVGIKIWSKVSNHHVWLRLLPFIFFIMTYLLTSLFVKKWTSETYLAIGLPIVILLSPMIIHYSFEIRPYSWTFFSVIFIYYIITKLHNSENKLYFGISGLIFAFLIWGRYNIFLQVFGAVTLILIQQIIKFKKIKPVVYRICLLSIPLIISTFFLYFLEMRFQWSTGVEYVPEVLLKNGLHFIFQRDFLISLIPLAIYLISYLIIRRSNKFQDESSKILFYYCLVINIIYVLVSFLGLYPYNPATRWNIDIVLLSFFGIISIISSIYNILKRKILYLSSLYLVGLLMLISFVSYSLYNKNNYGLTNYSFSYTQFENTSEVFNSLAEKGIRLTKISLLESSYYPNIRYLFEYGVLKDSPYLSIYPEIDYLYNSWTDTIDIVDFNKMESDCVIIRENKQILLTNISEDWLSFSSYGFVCYYKTVN